MLRPILILKLPEKVRSKLQSMGYEYIEDIEKALSTPEDLPTQLKSIVEEYKISDKITSSGAPSKIISGTSLWHNEFCDSPVAVFHKGLDKLLDGGLPVGKITELCGPPGCGKTQMCLQFCVDVQIPSDLGGSASEALYISTDSGFGVDRLTEIIQGSIRHCSAIEFSTKKERDKILENFTVEVLLNGVHVLQIHELNDIVQALRNLKDFLESNHKIRLLIIDSFSLPLVLAGEDLILRSKIVAEMLDILLDNAIKYKIAVVLTNQLVTIITQNNKAILRPCLGEGFGHRLHKRLLLDNGKIYLTKSIRHSQMYTCFEITKDGIR